MRASLAFWAICGAQVLMLSWLVGTHPWLWFVLLTLPLAWVFLRHENRKLQSVVRVFLDELAKDWKLAKVEQTESVPVHGVPDVSSAATAVGK